MSKLIIEINETLKQQLKVHLAKNNLTAKEFLTRLIEKEIAKDEKPL